MGCSSCGFANPPESRFCGRCGQPLQDTASRERRERRHLTVMFCDLAGSTALAERLDPEELSDLMLAYQQASAVAIGEFDGHVAQHLGDGLLVYFGYPVAHEDDAVRAAYAGLRILEVVASLNAGLDRLRQLSLRIGIHTGPVVIGEIGSGTTRERLALGSTPNVAARLQGIAESNTVVVSGETRALLKHACVCEALVTPDLKGLSQSIAAYQVVARAHAPSVSPSHDMVGRQGELDCLGQALERARSGLCAPVLVTAEAGLGKSRLVHAFKEIAEGQVGESWVVECSPHEQGSALSPVIHLLERMFNLGHGSAPLERGRALVSGLEQLGFPLPETVPLLASFLSIPIQAPFALPDVTPQRRKELTLEAVAAMLMRKAAQKPLFWLIEDLHWADPSTLEFIGLLISRAASTSLLLVMTARPTFASPWDDSVMSVVLKPLGRADANLIISRVTGSRVLPTRLIDQIIDRTDGIPLFVEELTKTILESGSLTESVDGDTEVDVTSLHIPTSLQASLTARLDRMGSSREVAQLASVIGREFDIEMLRAVAPWDEDVLRRGLERLTEAELVTELEAPPQARYSFRHALIRDAAYEMLLKSARRDYHHRIGTALLERFPAVVNLRPELAAHHFTEAGIPDVAIPHWMKAGHKAVGESANVEAISHLQRALALIRTLAPSAERDGMELGVHLTLGPPLTLARGYVVEEVERTYLRAQELNERVGDPRQQFWIGFAICQFRVIRGEIADGQRGAERLLELAQSLREPLFVTRAHCMLGVISCYAGEFASAASWLDLALAGLTEPDVEFLNIAGMDLSTLIHIYQAWTTWHLGFPDRAREHARLAVASAEATGRTHAHGHALVWAGAAVSHFLENAEDVRHYARQIADMAASYGFPVWALQAGLWSSWATAVAGERSGAGETALLLLRTYQATGAKLSLTYFMAVVAETQWLCGAVDRAESLIDEAVALAAKLPDPIWEAEVNRLKGELVRRHPGGGAGEGEGTAAADYFNRALAIARRQGSRALEDRAAASLARLAAQSADSPPAER